MSLPTVDRNSKLIEEIIKLISSINDSSIKDSLTKFFNIYSKRSEKLGENKNENLALNIIKFFFSEKFFSKIFFIKNSNSNNNGIIKFKNLKSGLENYLNNVSNSMSELITLLNVIKNKYPDTKSDIYFSIENLFISSCRSSVIHICNSLINMISYYSINSIKEELKEIENNLREKEDTINKNRNQLTDVSKEKEDHNKKINEYKSYIQEIKKFIDYINKEIEQKNLLMDTDFSNSYSKLIESFNTINKEIKKLSNSDTSKQSNPIEVNSETDKKKIENMVKYDAKIAELEAKIAEYEVKLIINPSDKKTEEEKEKLEKEKKNLEEEKKQNKNPYRNPVSSRQSTFLSNPKYRNVLKNEIDYYQKYLKYKSKYMNIT
jgi:hypothetical protein